MKKVAKWAFIGVIALGVILFAVFKIMQTQTKKASPAEVAAYVAQGKNIKVAYSSPSKRGREIFGGLVPYGEVWRTGANEATTFETATDLEIDGKPLPAGKYTLWTIPENNQWTIIFNRRQYGWGINFDGTSPRKPEADVLQVKVPVQTLQEVQEKFLISFEESPELSMNFIWDQTKVSVPIR